MVIGFETFFSEPGAWRRSKQASGNRTARWIGFLLGKVLLPMMTPSYQTILES
jgi:hypothetical protein